MRSVAVSSFPLCVSGASVSSRLFLRSEAPRRDFLSADPPPVTAALRLTEAGNAPTSSIRPPELRRLQGAKTRAWFILQAGDLEIRALGGSREEAPTPPGSDPENSTDGGAACLRKAG